MILWTNTDLLIDTEFRFDQCHFRKKGMKNSQICGSRALNLTFQIKYDYEKNFENIEINNDSSCFFLYFYLLVVKAPQKLRKTNLKYNNLTMIL